MDMGQPDSGVHIRVDCVCDYIFYFLTKLKRGRNEEIIYYFNGVDF